MSPYYKCTDTSPFLKTKRCLTDIQVSIALTMPYRDQSS